MFPNSLHARDIASLLHQQSDLDSFNRDGGMIVARGEGCRVWDVEGREYIEAMAGLWCASLGFSEFDWWFRGSAQPVPKVLDLAQSMGPAGRVAVGVRPATGLPAREIRFDGVRFAYPGTDIQVLDGFDLVVPAGHSLAIVGPNGAGKTTLAKLLCRLYDPQGGAVRVDGVDLRELDGHNPDTKAPSKKWLIENRARIGQVTIVVPRAATILKIVAGVLSLATGVKMKVRDDLEGEVSVGSSP